MNTSLELKTSEVYPLHVKATGENDPKIIYIRELIKQLVPGRLVERIVPHQEGFYGADGYLGYDDNVLYYAKVVGICPTTELFDNTVFGAPKGYIESTTDNVNIISTGLNSETMTQYSVRFGWPLMELPEHLFYAVYPAMPMQGNQWCVTMLVGYKIYLSPIA
jgi:hypothetical protein